MVNDSGSIFNPGFPGTPSFVSELSESGFQTNRREGGPGRPMRPESFTPAKNAHAPVDSSGAVAGGPAGSELRARQIKTRIQTKFRQNPTPTLGLDSALPSRGEAKRRRLTGSQPRREAWARP